VNRRVDRAIVATIAAGAAFAVAAATGLSTSQRGGFIDVPRGHTARFLGTTSTCENPKGQIPGGQVICAVDYSAPGNAKQVPPAKFNVGLALHCVDLGKWSRDVKFLKSARFC
jgi:hypothetical protein